MTWALFTSLDGGEALPDAVLDVIGDARALAQAGHDIELQVMCFAFTDTVIAAALAGLCREHGNVRLRIIADWSQSARGAPAVLRDLLTKKLRNVFVKFKLDAPYRRDTGGRLRYSYAASLGMLHHKTLLVLADGVPHTLTLGSYNWSSRGRQAYENLLITEEPVLLHAFAAEFDALWNDHRLSATETRVGHVMTRLKAVSAQGVEPRDREALADAFDIALDAAPDPIPPRRSVDGPVIAAFSGTPPLATSPQEGFALVNRRNRIDLLRPSGKRKPAPLTLNTIAIEAIRSVPPGARLLVALYALSPRVPEFQALIEAARRGVRLSVLLDGTIGSRMARALADLAADSGLQIEVTTTRRRMHQKYLCCPETGMVLTGTANMTADATERHADHRILWRNAPGLAQAFAADFDLIVARSREGSQRRLAPATGDSPA